MIHTASHIIWKTYSWVGRWFKKDFPFWYWNPRPMCCHRLLVNRDSFCSEKVFTSICIPRIIQTRLRYTKTVERNCQAFVILLCLSLSLSFSLVLHSRSRKKRGSLTRFFYRVENFETLGRNLSLCKESRPFSRK